MPHYQPPLSQCRFGIARTDITPPVGIYHRMWGAAAHDRSEGVHRPLSATAMVFEPEGEAPGGSSSAERQVLIAVDHCLLFDAEMSELLARAAAESGVGQESIAVVFSHTHGAGLMDRGRRHLPGGELIEPYLEAMGDSIAAALRQALARCESATIAYARGSCRLAAHRDYWDEANKMFVCGFNPHAPADDTVLAARVSDARGRVLATIVNYACHPTTLAWENKLISPDYPGAMRETVEAASGGAPCVFLLGASGELGPRDGYTADLETADRNGRQLGYAALSALADLPPAGQRLAYRGPVISGATLGVWRNEPLPEETLRAKSLWRMKRTVVPLDYRPGLATAEQTRAELAQLEKDEATARQQGDEARAADMRALIERKTRWLTRIVGLPPGEQFPYPVRVWRMGDAVWLAVEGEPYSLLQTSLRQRFPAAPIVVMPLANGSRAWYLPTRETYGKGIYQESLANLAAGSLERLIEAVEIEIAALLD